MWRHEDGNPGAASEQQFQNSCVPQAEKALVLTSRSFQCFICCVENPGQGVFFDQAGQHDLLAQLQAYLFHRAAVQKFFVYQVMEIGPDGSVFPLYCSWLTARRKLFHVLLQCSPVCAQPVRLKICGQLFEIDAICFKRFCIELFLQCAVAKILFQILHTHDRTTFQNLVGASIIPHIKSSERAERISGPTLKEQQRTTARILQAAVP